MNCDCQKKDTPQQKGAPLEGTASVVPLSPCSGILLPVTPTHRAVVVILQADYSVNVAQQSFLCVFFIGFVSIFYILLFPGLGECPLVWELLEFSPSSSYVSFILSPSNVYVGLSSGVGMPPFHIIFSYSKIRV